MIKELLCRGVNVNYLIYAGKSIFLEENSFKYHLFYIMWQTESNDLSWMSNSIAI